MSGLDVVPPYGHPFAAVVEPGTRAFLAVVRSTGTTGESARLIAVGGSARHRAVTVALGAHPAAQEFFRYQLRNHRRTIRVAWLGGPIPFAGVTAIASPRALRLTVFELYPPEFAPDDTPEGIADVGIAKCADVQLGRPLAAGAIVIDGARGHRPARARVILPPPSGCPSVRPGQRVDIPAR